MWLVLWYGQCWLPTSGNNSTHHLWAWVGCGLLGTVLKARWWCPCPTWPRKGSVEDIWHSLFWHVYTMFLNYTERHFFYIPCCHYVLLLATSHFRVETTTLDGPCTPYSLVWGQAAHTREVRNPHWGHAACIGSCSATSRDQTMPLRFKQLLWRCDGHSALCSCVTDQDGEHISLFPSGSFVILVFQSTRHFKTIFFHIYILLFPYLLPSDVFLSPSVALVPLP